MGKILSGERVHYIDVARGIAIILMVLGHILEVETIGRELVFSFHMPLFLIVSGYFFSDKGSFGKLLSKLLVKLLLPAFVILTLVNFINMFRLGTGFRSFISSSIHQIVLFYSWRNDGAGIIWDYPYGTGVMWFISLLFLIRLLYFLINKVTKGNIYGNLGICGVLTVAGYYISQNLLYWLPWSFDVALSSIIFFSGGHFLSLHRDKLQSIYRNWIFAACLFVIWMFNVFQFKSIELAMRTYPQGITSYITAVLGTIIVLTVSYHCERKINILSKILIWFGENSLYVLMAHHLEGSVIDYAQLWSIKPVLFIVKMLIVFILAVVIKFIVEQTGGFYRKLAGNR